MPAEIDEVLCDRRDERGLCRPVARHPVADRVEVLHDVVDRKHPQTETLVLEPGRNREVVRDEFAHPGLLGEPALAVPRWFALWESRVRLPRVSRLLLDARAMAQRRLIDGVAAPVRAGERSRAPTANDAGLVPGGDDGMFRPGRAVNEVPLSQRALLSFDNRERLTGENQEVLLIRLPVVHRQRLAGSENSEVDPELREVRLALEVGTKATTLEVDPRRLAHVEDEPALPRGDTSMLGRLQRRLRNHLRDPAPLDRARLFDRSRCSSARLATREQQDGGNEED